MKPMNEFNASLEITRKSYDMVAQKYFDLFKDELDHKQFDRDLLLSFARNFTPDSEIVDMGCGPIGHIGRFLFNKGYNVSGIDISETCISLAAENNPRMKFSVMDMSRLEYDDHTLDGIIGYYSIIHAARKYVGNYFQEFGRVLKKGGKLLIAVKSGQEEGYLENFLDCDTSIYFTHFSISEIEAFYLQNGFALNTLEERSPYIEEIDVKRIFAVGEKV